ncbi:hypothetical protein ACGYJ8_18585 [Sulfitobacter sp. 1A12126]|uniref:hypothetical protein n=1 Tax=Sulfitobacter sp. 1A12126 TaxID=3368591 RepID=UPI003746CEAD
MKFGLSLALILVAGPSLAQTVPGLAHLRDTSEDARPLSVSIWYPSEEKALGTVGGNPVFEGVAAAANAEFTQNSLPLVVMSHGGLQSATDSVPPSHGQALLWSKSIRRARTTPKLL